MTLSPDPHPPGERGWNSCPKPTTVKLLGVSWTCPGCGRVYYATDPDWDYDDGSFVWRLDHTVQQPPYVGWAEE